MSKIFMLAATLLLTIAWMQAQDTTSQGSKSSSTPTTVEGCLQGSNGSYTLTDSTGTTYQLQGDTSKLSKHVGHEVQITGSTSESSGNAMSNSTAGGSQMLTVSKMKHISETCKSADKMGK